VDRDAKRLLKCRNWRRLAEDRDAKMLLKCRNWRRLAEDRDVKWLLKCRNWRRLAEDRDTWRWGLKMPTPNLPCNAKEEKEEGQECALKRAIIKLLIMQFSPFSRYYLPFRPNYPPQHPIPRYPVYAGKQKQHR